MNLHGEHLRKNIGQVIELVQYGPPAQAFALRSIDLEKELAPKAGEIRIQVETFGVNFADILSRIGLYPEGPRPPSVLGYEVVGRIDTTGQNVSRFRVGQRVVAFTRFGGYATHALTSEMAAAEIPEHMDANSATALATQYCTAYFACEESIVLRSNDHVLVHAAAGGVGLALVQLLKKKNCVIHATAGSEKKLEFLRKCGIHSVINYRESDFTKIIRQKVPQGLDAAFDSIGGKTTRQTRTLLGPGGRLVSYGVAQLATSKNQILKTWNALKTISEFSLISPLSLLTRSQGIIGINMLRIADEKPQLLSRCLEKVVELAIQSEVQPYVGRVFHASEIANAHEWVANRHSIGKVVLSWDPSLIAKR